VRTDRQTDMTKEILRTHLKVPEGLIVIMGAFHDFKLTLLSSNTSPMKVLCPAVTKMY
jgi:hypothetical protein